MMERPLVSVIIPVYNVSAYLRCCLDSVISQTYKNLEIILVDDGSTDDSGEICEEYAKKDARIKVIHKENGGLSDARNWGLDYYSGEYVTFIDSDDFIAKEYVEVMLNEATSKNVRLVIGFYKKFIDGNDMDLDVSAINKKDNFKKIIYNNRETKLSMLYRKKLSMYAHGKLYGRELFQTVRFPKGKLFEDVPTIWEVIKLVDKVVFVDKQIYFYRQRVGSIVNSKYTHKKMDQVYVISEIVNEVTCDEELHKAAVSHYFFCLSDIFSQVSKEYKEDKKFLSTELKKYKSIVLHDKNNDNLIRIMAGLSYLPLNMVRLAGKAYKMYNLKKLRNVRISKK